MNEIYVLRLQSVILEGCLFFFTLDWSAVFLSSPPASFLFSTPFFLPSSSFFTLPSFYFSSSLFPSCGLFGWFCATTANLSSGCMAKSSPCVSGWIYARPTAWFGRNWHADWMSCSYICDSQKHTRLKMSHVRPEKPFCLLSFVHSSRLSYSSSLSPLTPNDVFQHSRVESSPINKQNNLAVLSFVFDCQLMPFIFFLQIVFPHNIRQSCKICEARSDWGIITAGSSHFMVLCMAL